MDPAWTPVLTWMFFLAITFVFVPPLAYIGFRRLQHSQRRKMVNGPRKIRVARDGDSASDPCAKGHERSKRNARQNKDGVFVSVCRTCGAPMRRNGPGDWVVVE